MQIAICDDEGKFREQLKIILSNIKKINVYSWIFMNLKMGMIFVCQTLRLT